MNLMQKYPRVCDLTEPARSRLPRFVHAYLAAGTGTGQAMDRNETALAKIKLVPRFLRGRVKPDMRTRLFNQEFAAPFGIAPIGLQSLIWPGSEAILAKVAARQNIPYSLSTVAGDDLETIGPLSSGNGWFQLYPSHDHAIMQDLLARAKASGFTTLIVTADVPSSSRREQMRLAGAPIGSRNPMSLTPRILWQCMTHPAWSLAALRGGGRFTFKNLTRYNTGNDGENITDFIANQLNGSLTWDYLKDIRKIWEGPMVIKGLLHIEDVRRACGEGVDGLIISNHGGRQLDAVPPTIEILPRIRDKIGTEVPLLFDSGVRSGLDIARALASGADFVMLGRAFMFGMASLGQKGGEHVANILKDELENTMIQLGIENLDQLKEARF